MEKRIEDWKDLRYGMFIHWGLYSLLERGEWVMWSEAIDKDEYRKLMHRFTAEAFDPHAWAQVAKDAGMKYMVLTTRHHDGFPCGTAPAAMSSLPPCTARHTAILFGNMWTPAGRLGSRWASTIPRWTGASQASFSAHVPAKRGPAA